jgi:hypothetical protein
MKGLSWAIFLVLSVRILMMEDSAIHKLIDRYKSIFSVKPITKAVVSKRLVPVIKDGTVKLTPPSLLKKIEEPEVIVPEIEEEVIEEEDEKKEVYDVEISTPPGDYADNPILEIDTTTFVTVYISIHKKIDGKNTVDTDWIKYVGEIQVGYGEGEWTVLYYIEDSLGTVSPIKSLKYMVKYE